MNKIVTILRGTYAFITSDIEYISYCGVKIQYNIPYPIDFYVYEKFGLKCVGAYNYKIVDESKFSLFMLKYPECIEKIYE